MLKLIPQSFERRHILGMSARQRGSDRCKSHQEQAALHLTRHITRFFAAGAPFHTPCNGYWDIDSHGCSGSRFGVG